MSALLFLEGGGNKDLNVRCREAFRRLWERCGFAGRMPKLVASGSRQTAYKDLKAVIGRASEATFVAMLVDSEDPPADIEETWGHLYKRDGWDRPRGAVNDQVLFMTTCMETWIIADRRALRELFGRGLHESALPPLNDMESRSREFVQNALTAASRDCRGPYAKGSRSFQALALLDPSALKQHLPSFARCVRILQERL